MKIMAKHIKQAKPQTGMYMSVGRTTFWLFVYLYDRLFNKLI